MKKREILTRVYGYGRYGFALLAGVMLTLMAFNVISDVGFVALFWTMIFVCQMLYSKSKAKLRALRMAPQVPLKEENP